MVRPELKTGTSTPSCDAFGALCSWYSMATPASSGISSSPSTLAVSNSECFQDCISDGPTLWPLACGSDAIPRLRCRRAVRDAGIGLSVSGEPVELLCEVADGVGIPQKFTAQIPSHHRQTG
jgi:hypothetical protein